MLVEASVEAKERLVALADGQEARRRVSLMLRSRHQVVFLKTLGSVLKPRLVN